MTQATGGTGDHHPWISAHTPDGRTIRYRPDVLAAAAPEALPFTLRLIWRYEPGVDGSPTAATAGAMDLFAGRLESSAADADIGVLAAEVRGDAVHEWVWLTRSAAGLGGLVNALAHEFEEIAVEVEPAHDPERAYLGGLIRSER